MVYVVDNFVYIQDRLDFLYSLLPSLSCKDLEVVSALIESYEKILKHFM